MRKVGFTETDVQGVGGGAAGRGGSLSSHLRLRSYAMMNTPRRLIVLLLGVWIVGEGCGVARGRPRGEGGRKAWSPGW